MNASNGEAELQHYIEIAVIALLITVALYLRSKLRRVARALLDGTFYTSQMTQDEKDEMALAAHESERRARLMENAGVTTWAEYEKIARK